MFKNRIVAVSSMFLIAFACIFVRICYLALNNSENSIHQIANQVSTNSILHYHRGSIFDRNGIPLSGKIVDDEDVVVRNYSADVGKDVVGDFSVDKEDTTSEGVKGLSGLQKVYDSELNGGTPLKIAMYSDAKGDTLNDQSVLVYGDHLNEGVSLVTTLDYHIQKTVEDTINLELKQEDYKGIAVVVSDVYTGEILAMASAGDQTNKALLCYQPGSVFKIVVAAQALEEGVVDVDTVFHCSGSVEIDGVVKHCYKEEGHGEITLKDAFAQSCNTVFYDIASRLNQTDSNGNLVYNSVLDLAKKFGFQYEEDMTSEKEFILSYDYSNPTIPSKVYNNLDVFNLALGQGKVMASPLTVNKIICTVANGGFLVEPSIVLSEISPTGEVKEHKVEKIKVFSKEVNDKLKLIMEEVAKTGTGRENSLAELGGLAGKSGTAQHISDRENHGWFAGYFPADNPRFAMTVFIEEGGTSTETALPLFDEIALEILEMYPN